MVSTPVVPCARPPRETAPRCRAEPARSRRPLPAGRRHVWWCRGSDIPLPSRHVPVESLTAQELSRSVRDGRRGCVEGGHRRLAPVHDRTDQGQNHGQQQRQAGTHRPHPPRPPASRPAVHTAGAVHGRKDGAAAEQDRPRPEDHRHDQERDVGPHHSQHAEHDAGRPLEHPGHPGIALVAHGRDDRQHALHHESDAGHHGQQPQADRRHGHKSGRQQQPHHPDGDLHPPARCVTRLRDGTDSHHRSGESHHHQEDRQGPERPHQQHQPHGHAHHSEDARNPPRNPLEPQPQPPLQPTGHTHE